MLKEKRGITLIALVVTIIVLLILAGVSISMVVGNNGIVNKARTASNKSTESAKQEESDLEELEEYINSTLDIEEKVKDTTPGELFGEGTEKNPYLIESIEDLVKLSVNVSDGMDYDGKYIELKQTMNFESDTSYINPDTTEFGDINKDGIINGLKQELITGNGFMPIGYVESIQSGSDDFGTMTTLIGSSFKGIFNGKNKAIKGLNIVSDENYPNGIGIGLFGWSEGVIKNLIVSGTIENTSDYYSGGITGFGNGQISNCINKVKIETTSVAGGIAGAEHGALEIDHCSNLESISGNIVGGVLGKTLNGQMSAEKYISITNCHNMNNITGSTAGGIIGDGYDTTFNIVSCYNTGKISSNSSGTYVNIGGIAGKLYIALYQTLKIEMVECYNTGEIYNTVTTGYVGGLIGYNNAWGRSNSSYINKCYNTGNIYSDSEIVGGIVGEMYGLYGNFTVCDVYNTGNIIGKAKYIGGISGKSTSGDDATIYIYNAYNRGKISGVEANSIGGIAGYVSSQYQSYKSNPMSTVSIYNCYNEGELFNESISSSIYIGGIVGQTSTGSLGHTKINNCINSGNITQASGYIGGILGMESKSSTGNVITSCYYNNISLGGINGSDVSNSAEYLENLPDKLLIIGDKFKLDQNGYPILK